MGVTLSRNDRVVASRAEQDKGVIFLYPRFSSSDPITFSLNSSGSKSASCSVGSVVVVNNASGRRSAGHAAVVLSAPFQGLADSGLGSDDEDDTPLSELVKESVVRVAWLYAVQEMDLDVQPKVQQPGSSKSLPDRYRFLCIDIIATIPVSSVDELVAAQPYVLFNQHQHELCIAGFYVALGAPRVVQFAKVEQRYVKSWLLYHEMLVTYPVADMMRKHVQSRMRNAVLRYVSDKTFTGQSINMKHFPINVFGAELQFLDQDLLAACLRDDDELVVRLRNEAQFEAWFGVKYFQMEPERGLPMRMGAPAEVR